MLALPLRGNRSAVLDHQCTDGKRIVFPRRPRCQNARLGAKHAAEAHPSIPLESLSESRSVCRDGVVTRLIRPRRDSSEKSVCITSNDSSGQCGLGGKMVMHACAFDTELSRKLAKAE